MLFDLQSGRRRNFIRVIYGMLAVLMGGGLILFGIGGEVSGGLLDGLGGGGGTNSSDAFEDQINEAEDAVTANPKDPAALLELARVRVSAGSSAQEVDPETGIPAQTSESKEQYERAADAWDRYLKLKPKPIDPDGATLIARAYVSLAESSDTGASALSNITSAAEAQQIVADASPSQGSLSQLAIYLYFSGETEKADAAAKQAAAEAEPTQKEQVTTQLAEFKKRAAEFQKQVKAAEQQAAQQGSQGAPGASGAPAPGADAFQNPLSGSGGGLSGGGLSGP